MKALLAATVVIGLVGLAQDQTADPTGTWRCETDINGQKRASTLTLQRDGAKLTGKMAWPDKQESKIGDGKFKDGKATFTAVREREGQKFTITYTVKVEGDTIKGKAEADFGGETRTFDFEGKREQKGKQDE